MREGLRSSSLKRRIPDLNVVTSEEVSRIDGEFDVVMSQGKSLRVSEDNDNVDVVGMEVENECRKCGSQIVKCCQKDISEGRLEVDDGGENDEVEKNKPGSGAEIVEKEEDVLRNSDGPCASGDKVGSIDEDDHGRSQVVEKVLRSRVVLAGGIGDNSGRKRKREMNGKGEGVASLKGENDGSTVDSEHIGKQTSLVKFIGPIEEETGLIDDAPVVLRVEDQDADHNLVNSPKRKRGRPKKYVDCPPEKEVQASVVLVKSEVAKSNTKMVGKLKKGKRGRPRKVIDHHIVDRIQMDSVKVAAGVEDEDLTIRLVGNQKKTKKKKGKRGRPRKNFSCPVEEAIDGEADDDTGNVGSKSVSKRGRKRRKPRKNFSCPVEETVDGEADDDTGNVGTKSVSKRRRKRRKTRKNFSCPIEEAVDEEADDDTGNVGTKSVSKRGRKRRRPKRFTGVFGNEIVEMKKVPFCDLDEGIEDDADNLCNKSVRNPKKKGKRGRPKKQKDTEVVKKIPFKKGKVNNDGKMKISLRTAPVRMSRLDIRSRRVPSKKEIPSLEDAKSVVSHTIVADTANKREETPICENNTSLKRKRVKTPGAVSVEKNMIRNRIVDLLLDAGWRVEYRPRQGREYNDAVYVNPEGKTHWSVTKAYFTLKEEVESGKVGCGASNTNFQFSPIPEEVLSKLLRVVSKTRSDKSLKKKKRHNYDTSDSSDEEFTKDKSVKRKYSARDGTPSKRRCALLVRQTHQGSNSGGDGVIAYSGKNSVLAWMIDSGIVPLDEKVKYMNRRKTKAMLEGSVSKDGIHCSCCKQVISVSEFENHSGSKLCEQYANVLLESGHSLLQCQLDAWNKQEDKGRTGYYSVPVEGDDPNDDTCGICGDGGDLMCCDGCPSTFHHDCLNIEEVPSGEWHCVYCSCKFCGSVGETASERDDDCDTTALSLATCSLCHGKYHQSCSDEVDAVCVESKQLSFCGHICKQIFERLQSLVGAKHDLDDGFSWTLLQRSDIEADAVNLQPEKILCNSKLAIALSVMDECFLPILDPRSGINLIRHIVYSCGSNFNRLNFSNFFTIILERGDELISAASVRIHGKGLAEMPFIGTRNIYRRQGMCRRLLSAIDLALGSLEVEKLVIPAVPELIHTWTSVFSFEPLEESVQQEMSSISMLVFPHTGLLQKLVSNQQKTIPVTEEKVKCRESGNGFSDVGADKSEVDNGSVNGKFDLNCAAPELPESSTDERHLVSPGSPAGNCEDEVKSVMNLGEITDASNLQTQSLENKDDQARASSLTTSSEGRILQPDLNIIEENMFGEEEKTQVHHCSTSVNLDGVVKNTRNSSDLIDVDGSSLLENGSDLNELPKSELDFDGTNCHGVSTLDKMRENHRFPVDKMGPSSSVMGCYESQVGCSNNGNSDVHGKEVTGSVVNSEIGSLPLKFVPESESQKTKEDFASDETRDQLCRKSSDSQMECTSLEPLKPDSMCTIS